MKPNIEYAIKWFERRLKEDQFKYGERQAVHIALRALRAYATENANDIGHEDLRPKGRWEKTAVRGGLVSCCSECGRSTGTLYEYDYCPNCGAKMNK